MPLTDLLQWLAGANKTGALEIERNRVTKVISFKNGHIVGCSSDDPPQRLGQYLLSREKITGAQLREALEKQAQNGEHLGRVLVGMGAISREELTSHLEAKAQETIYSVFDWNDAVFRFEDGVEPSAGTFPLDLRVDELLLRGLKRFDEMARIRQVFHDPGIVLRYTATPPSPEIFGNKMARSMYAAIDGERSIAEILLQVHGSDYIVHKFLFELHRNNYVEIAGIKETCREALPGANVGPASPPAARATPASSSGGSSAAPAAVAAAPVAAAAPASSGSPAEFDERLATARRYLTASNYEAAFEVLDALYREHPSDDSLRRLTAEAEAAFIDKAYRHLLPEKKVPVLTKPAEELATMAKLSPQEFFLLSRIDGLWDVRSIIQISPLREVDALRTLKRMRELGMIELRDPGR